MSPTPADITTRFNSKVIVAGLDDCWLWTGKPDNGYGRFWLNGRVDLAHRVAWILANGEIGPGLQIDHTCHNDADCVGGATCVHRACVNPRHLEPVTIGTNVLRGVGITATNARKERCSVAGHDLSGENLYITPRGSRQCVKCQRQRVRDWRAAS